MTPETMNQMISWAWIIGTFVVFYLVLIRPQKKREKKDREMRSTLKVGDNIVTIGGMCGKIISIKDDNILFETSADRTKILIKKWGISGVDASAAKEE